MKTILSALVCATALAGCAASGTRVNPVQLAGFQPGVTTEADVVQALGRPQSVIASSDGTRILSYAFVKYQIGSMEMNSATLTFDKSGKLEAHRTMESGSGPR